MDNNNIVVASKLYLIDSQTERTDWWLPRGGMEREFWVSRGKLLCIGWMSTKVLLHSTGNYIQYPVINHHGKEYEKEYIYIYIYIIHI